MDSGGALLDWQKQTQGLSPWTAPSGVYQAITGIQKVLLDFQPNMLKSRQPGSHSYLEKHRAT